MLALLLVLMVAMVVFLRRKPPAPVPGPVASKSQEVPLREPIIENPIEMPNPSENKPQQISIDLILGKVAPDTQGVFVRIDDRYATRPGMYMHKEAYSAFEKMHAAAAEEGISLVVISAMRTFNHQGRIWNDKWNGRQMLEGNKNATSIADPFERAREILRFSAMPGTSRHHWGTDIDLNSLVNSYFELGKGKRVYEWLQVNASRFGFCQPYTARDGQRPDGYEEEKWHWSYLPVAGKYLEAFRDSIGYDHIRGFDGWETAAELRVIENYVLGINEKCK